MTSQAVVRRFLIAFLGTSAIVLVVLRTGVLEHAAYLIEKGRLRALSEAVPSDNLMDQINRPNRIIAELATPGVVTIETTRRVELAAIPDVAIGPFLADERNDLRAIHPWMDPDSTAPVEPQRFMEVKETGSGFIFDAQKGYVLTNHHVIADADHIHVRLSDGRRYEGTVVGADRAADLAVLAIPPRRLHELKFGDSGDLGVGDEVFTIGNPFGLEGTFSRGIVSALGRSNLASRHGVSYQGFIQTDAVINPGNSGGPLVNRRGEVVGVNTAIITDSGGYDGVGFAIPSTRVVGLIPQLIRGREIDRGFLGVGTADIRQVRDMANALHWTQDYGVAVRYVERGSPADSVGLRIDDILVEVDGHRIDGTTHLMDVIALIKSGATVSLRYWRNDEFVTSQVTLARRPNGF